MKRVAFRSVGCKLNTYEEELARQAIEASQTFCIVPFDEVADVYVINTCTVTGHSDRKCRGYIRQAARRNPLAKIVVTGCYAQVSPDTVAAMPEVDLVVGNREKQDLLPILTRLVAEDVQRRILVGDIMAARDLHVPLLEGFTSRSRAFVKIQDGCDHRCSYCTIPYARGRSRSSSFDEVLAQLRQLRESGATEVVISGVHVGQYGQDLSPPSSLKALLERALADPLAPRLRLSSINPMMLGDELIDFMAGSPKICRHFHVSFQSGCKATLQRMCRPYDPDQGAERLARLVEAMPDACVGSDVIVGFPGETKADFEASRNWLEAQPLAYLHVFTYSKRPGTPAATMADQVPAEEKKRRNRILRELSEEKRQAFRETFLGQTRKAIAIREVSPGDWEFLTDNYIPLRVRSKGMTAGRIEDCMLDRRHKNWIRAHLPDARASLS